jgi:hypothetical protein
MERLRLACLSCQAGLFRMERDQKKRRRSAGAICPLFGNFPINPRRPILGKQCQDQ